MATAFNPFLVWHNQIWKRLAVCCNQIQAGQSCTEMTSHAPWNNEWIDHKGLPPVPSFFPHHLKCLGISILSLVNKIEVNNFQGLLEDTEHCRDGEGLVVIMPKNNNNSVSNVHLCPIVLLASSKILGAKQQQQKTCLCCETSPLSQTKHGPLPLAACVSFSGLRYRCQCHALKMGAH